ncbi:MAG: hypothetical protein ACJ712_11350 [Nitrososphaeraceae archaeon]
MTFKDLKKRASLEAATQQQPFWIWNVEEHKQEDIKTNGDCCFNHTVGLPQKDGVDKPLYGYTSGIIFSLL